MRIFSLQTAQISYKYHTNIIQISEKDLLAIRDKNETNLFQTGEVYFTAAFVWIN